jgi:hypothetical protein
MGVARRSGPRSANSASATASPCETTQVTEQGKGARLFGYTGVYGAVPGGQAK